MTTWLLFASLEQEAANDLATGAETTGLTWISKMEVCMLEYIQDASH